MTRFCYEDMVQNALLSVVADSLTEAAVNGLIGDHHFYINFKTNCQGVVIPDYLREKHPREIMIVIQHQYSDLIVRDDGFSVSLSFNGILETLTVPFNSIIAFVDPSVKFGLQFSPKQSDSSSGGPTKKRKKESVEQSLSSDCKIISFDNFRKK